MNHLLKVAVSLALAGCGASANPTTREQEPGLTEWIKQGMGEATCTTAPLDANCGNVVDNCRVESNATYDHPNLCSHTYLIQGTWTKFRVTDSVASWYHGPDLTGSAFPCDAAWVRGILYKKSGNQWNKVFEKTDYGSESGGRCVTPAFVRATSLYGLGVFRLAVQAGVLFTYVPMNLHFASVNQ